MSQLTNTRIIAPPVEEEVYPYRRVWRSISIQIVVMIATSVIFIVIDQFLGIQFGQTINFIVTIGFVALPVISWLAFSVYPERFVDQPRQHLMSLAVISGLTAAAIGIPLVRNFYQLDQWIALQPAIDRILAYTFTAGMIDTGLKFFVLRYLVFPQGIRTRTDAVAFCMACAVGYTSVVSLDIITTIRPTLTVATLYILGTYTMQVVSAIILSYGLSQTIIDNALPILLPITLFLASFIIGLVSTLEVGLVNSALTTDGGFARPLVAFGFLTVVLIIIPSIIFFFYTVAERREQERYSSE